LPPFEFWKETDPYTVQNPEKLVETIDNVIGEYDFIGVAERMDDSLITLSFLLNLTLDEIYFSNARVSGSYDYISSKKKCILIKKAKLTPGMKEYFDSDDWKASMAGDFILYNAAVARLDYTIDTVVGREAFEERLKEFKKLSKSINDQCEPVCANVCEMFTRGKSNCNQAKKCVNMWKNRKEIIRKT